MTDTVHNKVLLKQIEEDMVEMDLEALDLLQAHRRQCDNNRIYWSNPMTGGMEPHAKKTVKAMEQEIAKCDERIKTIQDRLKEQYGDL